MKIPITQAAPDLPPVPRPLVEKANALYTYLMHSRAPLGEQLQAVYRYTDEFSPFIAPFMSCSKGCSYCCHMDVQITTLEAEYIQVHAGVTLRDAGTITTGHRDPCPFLARGGSCGIYSSRPLMCRLYHAVGEPANCQPGRSQIHYGHAPLFGNPIYANLVRWVHHATIDGGGTLRDLRDFFPGRVALKNRVDI